MHDVPDPKIYFALFINSIMEEERTYGYFMHNVARAHAANYSVNVFK
jgi:hypothetical protein